MQCQRLLGHNKTGSFFREVLQLIFYGTAAAHIFAGSEVMQLVVDKFPAYNSKRRAPR